MSRYIFLSNIFSHFLLDLYSLTDYIHNQLAIGFPPGYCSSENKQVKKHRLPFYLMGAVSYLAKVMGQSTPFNGMKRGLQLFFPKTQFTLHRYYQDWRGS
jgi:hypothetical protein